MRGETARIAISGAAGLLEPYGASHLGAVEITTSEQVDGQLATWRQGDCVIGAFWFLFRTSMHCPLTPEALRAANDGAQSVEAAVRGLVVLTQTCDLVRPCVQRPFAEVSPLVDVDDLMLREIKRGRRPNFAFVPGVADVRLAADLDRVMTVEKGVVAGWTRTEGCRTDDEARRLSLALARKRARTAFPDDFVEFAKPLMQRMSRKHDRQSDEGRVLRALREIRVAAFPSWDANAVELVFSFIRESGTLDDHDWELCLTALPEVQPAFERFVQVDGTVRTLDGLTARD